MLLLKYMDSWAVYAIDIVKKMCLVMDPVETEEPRHEMEAKHKRNAIRVLSNLRRCIHECIPGVWIPTPSTVPALCPPFIFAWSTKLFSHLDQTICLNNLD